MFALASRPKQIVEGKRDAQFDVSSQRQELVFLTKCVRCKVNLSTPSAKVFLEECEEVEFLVRGPIYSGTMDIYKCKDVKIDIGSGIVIPVVSVETSRNIKLAVLDAKEQTRSFYVQNSTDIAVSVSGSVFSIPIPPQTDADCQLISCWTGENFTSEKVVREGAHGYPTTASKKAAADAKLEAAVKKFEKMITDSIKISKRPPPSKTGIKETKETKEPQALSPPPKTPISFSGNELEKTKEKLKPAETVEKHLPVVNVPAPRPTSRGTGITGPDTAIKDNEEKKEFFESPEELSKKLDVLAQWVKSSKHAIIFTGAGVSTSTGIPDFRSGMNTVLETGPGVWELRAHGANRPTKAKTVSMLQAIPSPCHMAIVELHNVGLAKVTVSQNVDGLHRRSGIPANQLAELHGNTNLETCKKCSRQYLRDFETRSARGVFNHETTRLCDDVACQGRLYDSIVNFGESLPEGELNKAFDNARKADLCIVLGSSLRVTPAANVPQIVAEAGGKLVICNLQRTPLDDLASMTIHAKCDDVMIGLLKERLGIDIPPFKVQRRLRVQLSLPEKNKKSQNFTVTGLDAHCDLPYSFIQTIDIEIIGKSGANLAARANLAAEPFSTQVNIEKDADCRLKMRLTFHGHYGEAPLEIVRDLKLGEEWAVDYRMAYDPMIGAWQLD